MLGNFQVPLGRVCKTACFIELLTGLLTGYFTALQGMHCHDSVVHPSSHIQAEGFVCESGDLGSDVLQFYTTVLGCISCIFISHGRVSNENLELWILTVEIVLKLVRKILEDKRHDGMMGIFVLQFSCIVIEPFTRFLRVHPVWENGFHEFVDELLEPIMHLLDALQLSTRTKNPGQTGLLLKLLEDVLSQGLFHPTHIEGFLSLQSLSKYKTSDYGEVKDLKTVVKSYHRHLFDKLEKIITGTNSLALGGIGDLFRLYVDCAKKQKGISVGGGGSGQLEDDLVGQIFKSSSRNGSVVREKSHYSSGLNSETRKSLFEFFVQIMEPLLIEINTYLQDELEVGPMLSNAHCTIKSINKILFSFMHGNVYARTEDTSEGACVNFLKAVYDMIMSFSAKMNHTVLSVFDLDKVTHKEVINLIAKELIVAVQCLLEIEYEVVGNDLENLWLMMISHGAFGLIWMDMPEQSFLTLEIIHLGCQLINLYSELRQVNNSVFALCKAVRQLLLSVSDGQMSYSNNMSCKPSLYYESCAKSAGVVLCSQEFRLSIYNAIKSIPEGQASGFIRQLTADISESLVWIKGNCSMDARIEQGKLDLGTCSLPYFNLQAEVLGRGLSELYTLILDSVTVSTGNSTVIGVSVQDLMAVIRPNMSSLVGLQARGVFVFLSTVIGRTINIRDGCKHEYLSTYWVVLFFFRLFMSSRSLYRQVVSLVPPDTSRKMSEAMGDSFTAYPGGDWLERTCGTDEGYFSWIVQPSASLLTTAKEILHVCVQDAVADCSSLIYVLNAMASQRLVDLNRLIKSFEYLLQINDILINTKLTDDTGLSLQRKKSRKWRRNVSDLRQEAAELTDFMMEYMSLVDKDQLSVSSLSDDTDGEISVQSLPKNGEWGFSIGAIDGKSLPTAIWWILCQNIDVWCAHAAKKKLKMFLSLLIQNSLHNSMGSFSAFEKNIIHKPGHLKTVTAHQISSAFLGNSVLYEQRFVRRHMASRICKLLEKLVSPIFRKFGEIHLNAAPDWSEVLDLLEKSLIAVSDYNNVVHDHFSAAEQISHSSNKLHSVNIKIKACQSLLKFLSWMPKGYISSRSFSSYAICILNLERLLIGSLIDCCGTLPSHDHYELFRLFMSCRRALKNLQMASGKENMESTQSLLTPTHFEGSFPTLWLFKSLSAVIELQHIFPDDSAAQAKEMIFSVMDHTSYVFLTFSKDQFMHAIHLLVRSVKPCKEKPSFSIADDNDLVEDDSSLDSSKDLDSWKVMVLVAETLQEQTHKLLIPFKEALCSGSADVCAGVQELKKLSCIIACFQGLLWGLASALGQKDGEGCNLKSKLSRWKFEPLFRLYLCIDTFAEFVSYFLNVLFLEGDYLPDAQDHHISEGHDDLFGVKESSSNMLYEEEQQNSQNAKDCSSSKINDKSYRSIRKTRLRQKNEDVPSFLAKFDLFEKQKLKKSLLLGFLRGENLEAAFFLRQLFIAYSAILRVNLDIKNNSMPASLVPIFVGISEVLLLEFANMVELPQPFCFVLLDGVAKFLEELGSWFPLTNATSTEKAYTKLINLHLRAIGKCISLQEKGATLTSHDTESSTKSLNGQMKLCESTLSFGPYCLDEFKARLRMSFKVFVEKPSESHLLYAVQALERALVGVQQGCISNYEICTGSSDGGKVSSTVAASIDCLDLVLEYVKGSKRLSVVKKHIQNLVASLFNIILHLQGTNMFLANAVPNRGDADPDPGSVILMSIEVLTRVFGKHALYQMDTCYVSQSLRIPARLFQNILHLRISEAPTRSNSLRILDIEGTTEIVESMDTCIVDRQFTIELYAACCRLLCTVLKHHKSESQQCIALLEGAVYVLLSCLEMVDVDPAIRKDYFAWKLQEGVKCAYFLRRIYEEIRQQKDVYSRQCFQFLSNYIWIYSGYGPLKMGIRREIDEALRPGVYALIDACSADDLQHIHTVFGEGPCRSTLATLQHDYKLNFQYEGKV